MSKTYVADCFFKGAEIYITAHSKNVMDEFLKTIPDSTDFDILDVVGCENVNPVKTRTKYDPRIHKPIDLANAETITRWQNLGEVITVDQDGFVNAGMALIAKVNILSEPKEDTMPSRTEYNPNIHEPLDEWDKYAIDYWLSKGKKLTVDSDYHVYSGAAWIADSRPKKRGAKRRESN